MKNKYGKFINIIDVKKEYYHIYFNDNKGKEFKRSTINESNKVSKINVIIDYQVESLSYLFSCCECIESIFFKRFNRNNIIDMSYLFDGCSSLKELNLSNFITNNVTNMWSLFSRCSSLKEINLTNFITNNVTDMSGMFRECSSLKELNLNNFDTFNVTNRIICSKDAHH